MFLCFKCVFYIFKLQKSDIGRLYHTHFECDIGGFITSYSAVSHSAVAKWMIKYGIAFSWNVNHMLSKEQTVVIWATWIHQLPVCNDVMDTTGQMPSRMGFN